MTLGDVGYVDDEGYLFLTDRVSNMIISGGVNIYPREIEDVLIGHPAVHDVAVIGVPHPEMGESVRAVVQLAEPADDDDAMAEELRAVLPRPPLALQVPDVGRVRRRAPAAAERQDRQADVLRRGARPLPRMTGRSSAAISTSRPPSSPTSCARRTGSPTTSASSTPGSPPSARGRWASAPRYDLQLDRDVADAPVSVVGKFAAEDEQARTFMASSGYPNEVCFYQRLRVTGDDPGPSLRARRHRRRRVVHAPPRGPVADATRRPAARVLGDPGGGGGAGARRPARAVVGRTAAARAPAVQQQRARRPDRARRSTRRPSCPASSSATATRSRPTRSTSTSVWPPRRAGGSRRARRPAASCTATSGPTT